MASIYDKSSLVLIPSGTKTGKVYSQKPVSGDGDFTFTRSSAATRVNADGNIEKETQNLILQSNQFDTTWNPQSGITLTANQAGYDGTNDAWKFEKNASSYRNIAISISVSGVYTTSLYAKAGTLNLLTIRDGSNQYARFYLNTGTYTLSNSPVSGAMVDVGNGWYRCSVTMTTSNPTIQIYPDWNQTTAGYIYIQDAQIEQGLVARDYIETTTTAVEGGITDNVPRLDYTDSSCPALLLEPQRTNLVPISEGVPEDTSAVTLTENYGTSPEGVQNSLKVQKNGVNANDRIYPIYNYNAVLVSGRDYAVSAFVKNIDVDGITTIGCRLGSGGTLFRLGYEWNGSSLTKSALYAAGTRTNEILEDYGNGWWRIGFSFEADNTEGNIELDIDRDNGSDTTSIETWGWQLESATGDASYATSYIPTYGSSVTRTHEGTFAIGAMQSKGLVSGPFSFMIDFKDIARGAASGNFIYCYTSTGGTMFYVYAGSIGVHTPTGEQYLTFPEADGKFALVYDGTNVKFFKNGAKYASTYIASTRWADMDDLRLYLSGSTAKINYNETLFFNTALTDQEAIDLTTI